MPSIAVIRFPGSNCDRDIITGVASITGTKPSEVWYKDTDIARHDLIILPGGFSFGDYLRGGAIAARAPIMDEIQDHVWRGGYVLGICNGFQILTESALLPGALMRNVGLKYVCRDVVIKAHHADDGLLSAFKDGQSFRMPVAHNEGNYYADEETLARLKDKGQIAFTYTAGIGGDKHIDANPNGAIEDIAGIVSENGRVLGMMPHPERNIDPIHGGGGQDGRQLLKNLIEAVAP